MRLFATHSLCYRFCRSSFDSLGGGGEGGEEPASAGYHMVSPGTVKTISIATDLSESLSMLLAMITCVELENSNK